MSIAPGGPYSHVGPTGVLTLDTQRTSADRVQPRAMYVPPGGFQFYNASLQRAIQKNGVSCIWDFEASIGFGGTALTDCIRQAYPALARARHFARYPWHGDTFPSSWAQGWNPLVQSSAFPFTWTVAPGLFNLGAAGAEPSFMGPFFAPMWTVQTTMPLLTYTHPSAALGYNGRSFSTYYFDFGNQDGGASGAGRQFDIALNGVVVASPTLVGDNKMHRVDILNAPNQANNVITFGNQRTAQICMAIICVASYPTPTIPTFGVHWCWFNFAGSATLGDLMRTNGQYPAQRIARYSGPSVNVAPFVPPDPTMSPPWAPNLVIFGAWDDQVYASGLGGQSAAVTPFPLTGADPARYYHGVRECIQVFRQGNACDIVFMKMNMPNGITSDNVPGAVYQMQKAWMYWDPVFRLAQEKGMGWVDVDQLFGERAVLYNWMIFGNPHPSIQGAQQMDGYLNQIGIG